MSAAEIGSCVLTANSSTLYKARLVLICSFMPAHLAAGASASTSSLQILLEGNDRGGHHRLAAEEGQHQAVVARDQGAHLVDACKSKSGADRVQKPGRDPGEAGTRAHAYAEHPPARRRPELPIAHLADDEAVYRVAGLGDQEQALAAATGPVPVEQLEPVVRLLLASDLRVDRDHLVEVDGLGGAHPQPGERKRRVLDGTG